MKRTVLTALVVVLILSLCFAYAEDYSTMSEEALLAAYSNIRNEIALRHGNTFYNDGKIQCYVDGIPYIDEVESYTLAGDYQHTGLIVPIVIVNQSDNAICFEYKISNVSVNGWITEGGLYKVSGYSGDIQVPSKKKAKGLLVFYLEETDIKSSADFTDAEFRFSINPDYHGELFSGFEDSAPVTIVLGN